MHPTIRDVFEYIIMGGSAVGVISLFFKGVRKYFRDIYNKYRENSKAKDDMPKMIIKIDRDLDELQERMKIVEYEVSPNGGGSMKDIQRRTGESIQLIKAEIEASNWLSPRPTFRTTSSGLNIFVNEAFCQLCGVTSNELMKLGWKNFAFDEKQADDYYKRWLLSSHELSQFSSKLKFKNKNDEYRGEWTIRIRMLGRVESLDLVDDYIWHGALYPFDAEAKAYAKQYGMGL